jgi:[acyl-carrier-protein] S-malonyltransferase
MSGHESVSKIAIGFPGQGSHDPVQIRRLLKEHPVAIDVIEEGEHALEQPLLALLLSESTPESSTRDNQVRLYLGSCALWRAAEQEGVIPNHRERIFFGASAGEYAALMAAGAYDFATGLQQINVRGHEMHNASIINPGKMLVASGISFDDGEKLAAQFEGVFAVNDNPGMQTVFSGSDVGLMQMASYIAGSENWKHVRLDWPAISEAAHSVHMAPAVAGVQEALKRAKIKKPPYDFVSNQAKIVRSTGGIKSHLASQLTRGVLLRQSAQYMVDEHNVDTFVDVGPGKILYSQMRRQFRRTVNLVSVVDELLPENKE